VAEYELVAVARQQQSGAPPVLTELGPIVAPTITVTRRLRGVDSIAFSCVLARLEAGIRSRLLRCDLNPTEVWLYRDGVVKAAGFVAGYQLQGETLTVTAPGLLGYLAYMAVESDLAYTGTDQTLIGKGLVDQWQALAYGNFGIDTSAITASGVTRDRTYKAAEQHQVLQRLNELGAAANGFDVDLNPATRRLLLTYPQQGTDLSAAIILDDRNITSADVTVSVAPGDLASEAYGTGGSADAAAITSHQSNATLRAAFGRCAVSDSFDGVTQQATLDQHTLAMLDARDQQLFVPGPGLVPLADVAVGSFDIGDSVSYDFDAGLGQQTGVFRVAELQTTVDLNGREDMAVKFA
jgi:hypothetical protein